MVLKRVEVSSFGTESRRDLSYLARGARVVRRHLAPLGRLPEAAAAGREDNGARVDLTLPAPRPPAVLRRLKPQERRLRQGRDLRSLDGFSERFRDREPGLVANLEEPRTRGAAAASQPVAPVRASELDTVVLEPCDRAAAPRRSGHPRADGRLSRGSSARRPRREARGSPARSAQPGCRPEPSLSCRTGASPWLRARRVHRRDVPTEPRSSQMRPSRRRARQRTWFPPRPSDDTTISLIQTISLN